MDLYEFLWRHKISRKKLSEDVGISRSSVDVLVHRTQSPTLYIAAKIVKYSGKLIKYEELLSIEDSVKIMKLDLEQKSENIVRYYNEVTYAKKKRRKQEVEENPLV